MTANSYYTLEQLDDKSCCCTIAQQLEKVHSIYSVRKFESKIHVDNINKVKVISIDTFVHITFITST